MKLTYFYTKLLYLKQTNSKSEKKMSNLKQISTSTLAKKLSMSKYQLDELLLATKYIIKDDKSYKLTDLGVLVKGLYKW